MRHFLFTLILFLSCSTRPEDIPGCTDSSACNFNTEANEDDGSCSNEIDCLGICGGGAYIDPCGYCDADTENDCSFECSEILSQISIEDVNYNCDSTETILVNNKSYYCNDLKVIQNIIINNPESIHIGMDADTNNIISALEYGDQSWKDGRLEKLDLNYNENVIMPTFCNFRLDSLPDNIGALDSLRTLIVKNNQITTLPESIGDLGILEKLILESNRLISLPESIGNLKNLEILYALHNQITSLPDSFTDLENLKVLWLQDNNLESLPVNIGNLGNLKTLWLHYNQLTSIPLSIGQLQSLRSLKLDYNLLDTLPDEICNLDTDEDGALAITLTITNNLNCPEYPTCVDKIIGYQNCEHCASGYLIGDGSAGEDGIDSECLNYGDWQVLQDIIDNNVVYAGLKPIDIVPDGAWIRSAEDNRLFELKLKSEELNGQIPLSIGNLDSLKILHMNTNQLTGIIPETIGNLTALQEIKLNSNHLTDNIPTSIGSLKRLELLWLNNNYLSGAIPNSIGNLVKLEKLRLEYNDLTNSIPESIGNLLNMKQLYLRNNKLFGTIPSIFNKLLNLQRLKLQENYFTGQIPENICTLNNMMIYLDQNQLCPPYPDCGDGPITSERKQDTSECSD